MVIPTFAEAFPGIDWRDLTDAASDPGIVGLALVPPVTCLITHPFPTPPESRILSAEWIEETFAALEDALAADLPAGISRRHVRIEGAPLSVMTLRRALDPQIALDRMIASGFLTDQAAEILHDAAERGENLVIAGPSSSGRTALLYACIAEIPADRRVVLIEEPSPRAHTWLPTPPNVERVNPLARYGLAHVLREELRSSPPPDVMAIGEAATWAVSLALDAALEDKWALMATVRARSMPSAVERLTSLTASDQLRVRQPAEEIEEQVVRVLDLVGIMDKRAGRAWLSRLVRPVTSAEYETVYWARQTR